MLRAVAVFAIFVVATPADANLLARWAFDDGGGGTTVFDHVGGFDGTLANDSVVLATAGIHGGALDVGDAGYVNVGDHLEFGGTERFSIQAWVKTTRDTGAIIAGRHISGFLNGYWIGLNDPNDGPPSEEQGSFHLYQSDNPQLNSGNVGINDGEWHQVVAVRDTSSANQIRIYVDGQRVPAADSAAPVNPLLATTAPFLIGAIIVGVEPTTSFTGLLDEIRVWDNALSDSDVAFYYEHPESLNKVLCGDWNGNGSLLAGDAQGTLRTAVGTSGCLDCVCDVNGIGGVTSTDALLILKKAVGQEVSLACGICIAGDLLGLRWEIPCKNDLSSTVCASDNIFSDSATLLGDPGTTYDVTMRFRGVVEQKGYVGGVQDGMFYSGGIPGGDGHYNIYRLHVSDPPNDFYLNAGEPNIEKTWLLDVTRVIPINGGATVTLDADALDGAQISNVGNGSGPIVPPGVPPAPEVYDGQFVQMDVLSIEE